MEDVLRFVNILSDSLVVGGNFFSVWVLRPTLRAMSPREDLAIFRQVSRRVVQYMPIVGLLVPLTGIGVLIVDRNIDSAWTTMAIATGFALVSVALIPFDVPIAKRLDNMALDTLDEAEFARLSAGRDRFHLVHLLLGGGALAFAIVSALLE
jgi:hypothetical protein